MRDFDVFRQAVTGGAIIALFDAPWTLVYALLCFVLHPVLGVMALVGMGCLVGLSFATERATLPRLEKASEAAARSYGSQAQAASASELIRALGMREAIVRRHQNDRSTLTTLQSEASFAAGQYMGATKFIRLSLQSLGLGLAAWLAVGQAISPGAIFAASLLTARALTPLEMLLGSWRSLGDARSAFAGLCVALENAPAGPPRTVLPTPNAKLSVEGLAVAGALPDRPILQGVSFEVGPGEVLGLVGASGAGKTTLVRALVGAIPPSRGAVRLDHASLNDWDAERLGRHIGYLPQDLGLLAGTVKQNICRFRDTTGEQAEELDLRVVSAAQICGAHELILRLPSGYDTMLGHQGGGLSLGQAQRVALARALFDQPRFLILDEPNAHLDGEGETRLLQALSRAKAWGAAIVLVAHRATMLPIIDSLLVLQDGRVTHHGPRDDVLEQINAAPRRPQQLTREPKAA
jgi:ATP-binding cassette subfamily C protein